MALSHVLYGVAEDNAINILFGGHYRTESAGVQALGEHLKEKFGFDTQFIRHPTGQ